MIYIYSDGYQDQFGGEKGKKYMKSKFKKLLQKISKSKLFKYLCRIILVYAYNLSNLLKINHWQWHLYAFGPVHEI